MNVRNIQHPLLPKLTADERSRQRSVVTLRKLLNTYLRPRNVDYIERKACPHSRRVMA